LRCNYSKRKRREEITGRFGDATPPEATQHPRVGLCVALAYRKVGVSPVLDAELCGKATEKLRNTGKNGGLLTEKLRISYGRKNGKAADNLRKSYGIN
jgi:hypothetical protein